MRHGWRCVCDLVDVLGAGQSRLSFHMKVLKDAGLVVDRREGRWIHYALSPEGLEAAGRAVASLRDSKGAAEAAACCAKWFRVLNASRFLDVYLEATMTDQ